MKQFRFLFLILSIAVFASCGGNCINENNLFLMPNQSYVVPVDSMETLEELLNHLDQVYCPDIKVEGWPLLLADTKTESFITEEGKNLPIGIEPNVCPGLAADYDLAQVLEIIKDGNNYTIEGQRVEFDSIPSIIKLHYLNYGKNANFSTDPRMAGIWIIAYSKEKIQDLYPLIHQCTEGYKQVMNEISLQSFDKKLCKLSEGQMEILKKEYIFHLGFRELDPLPSIDVGW